jgi:hypothetical protein
MRAVMRTATHGSTDQAYLLTKPAADNERPCHSQQPKHSSETLLNLTILGSARRRGDTTRFDGTAALSIADDLP